ncbi:MAG: hypothetical protein D6725_10335, partial [Planctomycetota bacterium]
MTGSDSDDRKAVAMRAILGWGRTVACLLALWATAGQAATSGTMLSSDDASAQARPAEVRRVVGRRSLVYAPVFRTVGDVKRRPLVWPFQLRLPQFRQPETPGTIRAFGRMSRPVGAGDLGERSAAKSALGHGMQ